jgi:hypothetical protein
MKVVTVKDYGEMPSGSCIQEAKLIKKDEFYSGLWCSAGGSYRVKVPTAICKEWEDPFAQLFEYLEEHPSEPESKKDSEEKFDKCDFLCTEILNILGERRVKYHRLDITEMPDDELFYEFDISVEVWDNLKKLYVTRMLKFKIWKQQLIERRYDILKRMAYIAVKEMFPLPKNLDEYFANRERSKNE